MKSLLFCFILLCGAFCLTAQAPGWQWVRQAGGTSADGVDEIAIDGQGNQYVTGRFIGTASFGSFSLTSSGFRDIYVAKLDPAGNWLWAVRAGGTADLDYVTGIGVDGVGNVFVAGYFNGNAAFGPYTLTSSGFSDIFAAKLDSSGNWLWARRAGGANDDYCYDIAVDSSGTAYLTGSFIFTASFGSYTFNAGSSDDCFCAKLDSGGNWLWASQTGSPYHNCYGLSVALNGAGNPFWAYCNGSVLVIDGPGAFLVQTGGTGSADCFSIAVDSEGEVWISGSFVGSVDFGGYTLTTQETESYFLAKASGISFDWAVETAKAPCYDIALSDAGILYVTGRFWQFHTWGSQSLIPSGWCDIFVAALNTQYFYWLWATRAGGAGTNYQSEYYFNEAGYGIAIDGAGNACVAGCFSGSAGFGPFSLTSSGSIDVFLTKLSPPAAAPVAPANPAPARMDTDILLSWDAVTQNVNGEEITPNYHIYADYGAGNGYELRGTISDTFYEHIGGAQFDHVFYRMQATTDPATNKLYIDAVDARGNEIHADIWEMGMNTLYLGVTPLCITNYTSGYYYATAAGYLWGDPLGVYIEFSGIDRWITFNGEHE